MSSSGTWRSLVSALVWGTRGRRFKSGRPDGGERTSSFAEAPTTDIRPAAETSGLEASERKGALRRSSGGVFLTAPNVLSGARLGLVPVFVTLYLRGREEVAITVFIVGASSDFIDGYLARRTNSVTELGKLLDPLADRVFIGALAGVLVVRGLLDPMIALTVIARDVVIISGSVWLARQGRPLVPVSMAGKAATACLLIGLTWLALAPTSWRPASVAKEAGNAFIIAGGVLYYAAGANYVRAALRGRSRRGKEALREGGGQEPAGPLVSRRPHH